MLCFVGGQFCGPRVPQTGVEQSVRLFGVGVAGMAVKPWSSFGPGRAAFHLGVNLSCLPQDIITALEERLRPLVQAELSVLVDVLHWPELLFLEGSEAYQRCESGGFLSK